MTSMINCRLCFVHFRSTVRPSQRRDVKDVKEDGHMEKTNAARRLSFASDYMEGCHPRILQRLAETNMEQSPGYGLDRIRRSRGG